MLRRLYVDNYKCLVDFDLPLRELSLLLGPNGAGKTSVLDVVFALRQVLEGVAGITDDEAFPHEDLDPLAEAGCAGIRDRGPAGSRYIHLPARSGA